METRDILDYQGNIIGQLSMPEGTSEEVWQEKLNEYIQQPPTQEELETLEWSKIKEKRKQLFLETEWIKLRHRDQQDRGTETTLTTEQYQAWLDYWQALRDLTEIYTDPFSVQFPDKPNQVQ